MNTAGILRLKIKLIEELNKQAQCDQLVESELQELESQKEELVTLGLIYIVEVTPTELRTAMSSSSWIAPSSQNNINAMDDDAMVAAASEQMHEDTIFVLEGLKKLIAVQA